MFVNLSNPELGRISKESLINLESSKLINDLYGNRLKELDDTQIKMLSLILLANKLIVILEDYVNNISTQTNSVETNTEMMSVFKIEMEHSKTLFNRLVEKSKKLRGDIINNLNTPSIYKENLSFIVYMYHLTKILIPIEEYIEKHYVQFYDENILNSLNDYRSLFKELTGSCPKFRDQVLGVL